ncbi:MULTISPECIES: BglG family transcription antiterminator [Fusobacterium]|jgi:mannitol operon transcriptional antiterminator|uniref:HTH domain-containing protein n=2 Tax=Fusobacterium varium TaxID=856 RepID=A0ABN5JGG1_FUSVA|nr:MULTISPECIES: PTS sugar transporter subunit IIA [Fusobacterium]AVQ31139.1 HTH domain-containing protein [Fusobacterium varium ATCC 27725]EES62453.1 PRD domain protein [Fusobacterium varium ATCC 27725]MCF0171281.1 helix-turn-helix domain-containing protein [Fusobacterium varium]MCF2673270.1 helix-turn-helix domain-containing protein [Fusobacterium varium]MCI6031500.1 PTS sugar transporter subunit IIA [Fusobacterium varium]
MSLNRRDIKLLEKINNNIFPISSLAEKYSVSERNIRYSIDNINFYLRKMELPEIVIKKGNLEFSINDKELDSFIEALNMNIYVFSQEERKDYILINYLFRENVKISEMEEDLKVSRTTIKKDLKDLEKYLAEFELSFYRDENGMYITGKEKKLRHLKLLKMLDYIEIKNKNIVYIKKKYFNKKEEQKIIAEYIKEYDIKKISDVIDEIEEELNAHFTGEFKNIMGIYLIATFERIKNGHIIIQKNNSDFLRKLEEYRKIKNILKKVIDENQEYEILHLTEYFLSGYYNDTFSENILMLERFISKILENMDIEMGTHLLKDRELVEKFMKYLLPAIYRIKNNFYLNKKLDFSEIDIELFNKVKEIIEKNSHYLKEPLRDEEIFYVSKYIEEYMEQKRNKKISLKELLKLVQQNAKDVDNELLAESIKEKFGIFIDDDREKEIDYGLIKLLGKNRIFVSNERITFGNALEIGLNILLKDKCIKEKSIYNLKDMVEKFGRYLFIDKRILFCYDKEKENCIKPGITLVVSKEGIKVDEEEDADILFLLTARNKIEHLKVISELIRLIEKKNFLNEIIELKKPEDIKDKIKNLLKE